LDPANGGGLLAPAEVVAATGMPAFPWLERAHAEARAAGRLEVAEEADLQRARALDPELGQRMADRRDLHRYLQRAELLPSTQLAGAVRWTDDRHARIGLAYDRLAPDGRWARIRIEVELDRGRGDTLGVVDGRLQVDDRLRHFLTRHFATPLTPLRQQLEPALGGRITRIGRGWIGPFWFPGVSLPEGVPPELGGGLVLHASVDVIDPTLKASRFLDPLEPPIDLMLSPGWHEFRERRYAAAGPVDALRAWSESRGIKALVVPVPPPPRPRR
jgi:hypothetical protein